MNVAFLVLQATAITLVLSQGSIFEPFRRRGPRLWRDLMACPLCLGTWIGMICAVFTLEHAPILLGDLALTPEHGWWRLVPYVLGIGCITAISALTIKRLWDLFEAAAFSLDAATGSQPLDSGDNDP